MKKRRILAGSLVCSFVAGCASTTHLAPQAPDRPWQQSDRVHSDKYVLQPDPALKYEGEGGVADSRRVYTLPELIDLAERANPETRIAWEEARQAATAVGLIEASYLPQLSAEVLAGVEHTPLPIPPPIDTRGYFITNTNEVIPGVVLKWLVFDFGKRGGKIDSAKLNSIAANIAFTGAHQKLIFEVTKAYFTLDAVQAQLRVAEDTVKSAEVLQASAEAKKARGLQTITDLTAARRNSAQARFDLEKARAASNDAYHGLLESMGVKPTLKLNIADSSGRALRKSLAENADAYIDRALAGRPDVLAKLAQLRASEAGIRSAEASYYPSIDLLGYANQNIGGLSTDGSPTYRVNEPALGVLLKISLPLYDGGTRHSETEIAQSKSAAAKDELAKTQDAAIRQVAKTYDSVKSSLAEYDSALALVSASDTAYSAAMDSYRHGVGTFTDAITAQTGKSHAQSVRAEAYASVLTSAAALAFSTGQLTSSDMVDVVDAVGGALSDLTYD